MEMQELWARTCEALKRELSMVTYNGMIEGNLLPQKLEGHVMTFVIVMEQLKNALVNKYQPAIEKCLSEAAGQKIRAEVLTRSELEQREKGIEPTTDPYMVQLNPQYTFDTFVVGNNNRFAHAASIAVADNPAEVYNPLFIYGGVGLGKTHLIHAIGHRVHELYPDKKLLYITSETFTNELISAIQQGRNMEFRNRFRNVDILMVDDIQFIAGRDSTQEEFFHTFNALHNAGKQIILTCDRPPQDLARLEERLRSRFAGGLTADVKPPDYETRKAILRERLRERDLTIPDDVIELIAVHSDTSVRELEGNLKRLLAYASLINQPITLETCRESLKDIFEKRARTAVTAQSIMRVVCEYYAISEDDMLGPTRRREIAVPRQIAMFLTREMTGLSLPQIGAAFGHRDHTTVLHSYNQIAAGIKQSTELATQVSDIRQMVQNN